MDPMRNSTATKIILKKTNRAPDPIHYVLLARNAAMVSGANPASVRSAIGGKPTQKKWWGSDHCKVIVGNFSDFSKVEKSPEQIWVENNKTLMKQQLINPWLVTSACPKRSTMTLEKACQCLGFLLQLPRKECTRVAPGIQSWYCLMPKGVIPSNRWCTWNPNFRVA